MSDYPMLISNKLHSFRNFEIQRYKHYVLNQKKSEKKFHGIAKKLRTIHVGVNRIGWLLSNLSTLSRDSRR